jgi:hypothetical protein
VSISEARDKGDVVGRLETRSGARSQQVRLLRPAADGALIFETNVKDWEVPVNVEGAAGTFRVHATLTAPGTDTIVAENPEQELVLDGTPPEDVHFVEPSERAERGSILTLTAAGKDPESDIGRVQFFWSKPADDLKVPADAERGKKDDKTGAWTATLTVPVEAKVGVPLPVSVVFTNNVGLSTVATTKVVPFDPPTGAAKSKVPASISGRVVDGPNPKINKLVVDAAALRPQVGMTVELRNAAGASPPITTVKSVADGKFKFDNVAPGTYTLFTLSGSDNRRASFVVEVKESEQKTGVELRLQR